MAFLFQLPSMRVVVLCHNIRTSLRFYAGHLSLGTNVYLFWVLFRNGVWRLAVPSVSRSGEKGTDSEKGSSGYEK